MNFMHIYYTYWNYYFYCFSTNSFYWYHKFPIDKFFVINYIMSISILLNLNSQFVDKINVDLLL